MGERQEGPQAAPGHLSVHHVYNTVTSAGTESASSTSAPNQKRKISAFCEKTFSTNWSRQKQGGAQVPCCTHRHAGPGDAKSMAFLPVSRAFVPVPLSFVRKRK